MITKLLEYEKNLFDKGVKLIAGVDEVGRGPLAGPFVAAAVILDLEKILNMINDVPDQNFTEYSMIKDSKKLTPLKRLNLAEFIKKTAVNYSIIEIPPQELDKIGISQTTQKSFYTAIQKLSVKPDHVLTDAFEIKKITKENQTNIIGGDGLSITIAAASIIAKVYRDNIMIEMHKKFPEYGFDKHKGYGTKAHLEAIGKYGPCEIHRKSFDPVKNSKQF